jgi:hypothetical protein
MKFFKKGQVFNMLGGLAVGIATLAITLIVTFLILSQGKAQGATIEGLTYSNATQCASSDLCTGVNTLTNAVAGIPNWVPLVIIASIGAVLLGLVALFRR